MEDRGNQQRTRFLDNKLYNLVSKIYAHGNYDGNFQKKENTVHGN